MYADCLAQGRGWGGGRGGGCWRVGVVGAVSNTKITAITSEFNTIVNHNRSFINVTQLTVIRRRKSLKQQQPPPPPPPKSYLF